MDLAVGIIIGAAFATLVSALVKDVITPLISAIYAQPDFSSAYFTVNGSKILYGDFISAALSFLLIAITVFFFIVKPVNKLTEWNNRNKKPDDPTTKKCPYCLSTVPKDATKCSFCTSALKK